MHSTTIYKLPCASIHTSPFMGMLGRLRRLLMKKDPFPLMLLQLSETAVVFCLGVFSPKAYQKKKKKKASVPIKMSLIWCAKSVLELTLRLHLHQQCDIAYTNLILPCLGDESNL